MVLKSKKPNKHTLFLTLAGKNAASRGMRMGVIKTWSSFMTDSHPTPLLADVVEYQYVESRGS